MSKTQRHERKYEILECERVLKCGNRINDLRRQPEAVQIYIRSQHSNPDTYALEIDIKVGLETCRNVEESILRQKSRL